MYVLYVRVRAHVLYVQALRIVSWMIKARILAQVQVGTVQNPVVVVLGAILPVQIGIPPPPPPRDSYTVGMQN